MNSYESIVVSMLRAGRLRKTRSCLKAALFGLSVLLILGLSACDQAARHWDKAKALHTAKAYEEFIAQHPESKFRTSAESAIEELDWAEAQNRQTADSFKNFITRHPDSDHRADADALLEDAEWSAASMGSFSEVQNFRASYPASKHRERAEERAAHLALDAAADNLRAASILGEEDSPESLLGLVKETRGIDENGHTYTTKSFGGASLGGLLNRDLLLQEACRIMRVKQYHIPSVMPMEGPRPGGLGMNLGGGVAAIHVDNVAGRLVNDRGDVAVSQADDQLQLIGARQQLKGNSITKIISMGDRSLFRISGKVTGLFPPIVFNGAPKQPLAFMLVAGKGLTYVSGAGTVIVEPGAAPIKFPEAVGGDGRGVERITEVFNW